MLKALELVGFKSFADKTRFEFPSGITTIVGPNGSGKSNVVDAIKWVLGEQSVKSLRGREMADVIFNGSGSRPAVHMAEATLTIDNSAGLLALDTAEVHITRRVYRSGEGEYLINRQPTRLRDIRDLLAGTGAGTDAYSIIEQGKVDVLLQASSRERRVIFEEAAGISRFKAKKVETERRLERVEQNLLRLSDIVQEVEHRLRSIRAQAAKARRYRDHVARLQELRTQVALTDWRRLGEELADVERRIAELEVQRRQGVDRADTLDCRIVEADADLERSHEAIRQAEAQAAQLRQRIAAGESTAEHERLRLRDLEEEAARHRRYLAALSGRAGGLRQQLAETEAALAQAESDHALVAAQAAAALDRLSVSAAQLDELRRDHEAARVSAQEQARVVAALGNEAAALDARLAAARAAAARCQRERDEIHAQRETLAGEQQDLLARQQRLSTEVEESREETLAAQNRLGQLRRDQVALEAELNQLRRRHAAVSERASVLSELERRLEGLGPGVKQLLARCQAGESALRQVRGLVADLIRASVDNAQLIDVALGEFAQYIVAAPEPEFLAFLEAESSQLDGRVGLILDGGEEPSGGAVGLDGRPGVLGRADRFVEVAPADASLARRLLGRTWLVERLSHALALAREPASRDCRLVTLAGELVCGDGTVLAGPRQAGTGLISRRSELRALRHQLAQWDAEIIQLSASVAHQSQRIALEEQRCQALADRQQAAAAALADHRMRVGAAAARKAQIDDQLAAIESELAQSAARIEQAQAAAQIAEEQLQAARSLSAELEATAGDAARRVVEAERLHDGLHAEVLAANVELAKSAERLAGLRARQQQYQYDQDDRRRAIADAQEQLARSVDRAVEAQRAILGAEAEGALLYLAKEALVADVGQRVASREMLAAERTVLVKDVQQARAEVRAIDERLHAERLAAGQLSLERNNLADRLHEDYAIDLAALAEQAQDEPPEQRAAVEQEISDLRRKINQIGNVNLDALAELEEMEVRFAQLSGQYEDLAKAKRQLEQIIGRINADSRRLFLDTLEAVRINFQTLFRKLFGGGHADIVLENEEDVLESGVEIIARPPGKEPRNISLLSGGEKTLTCVAVLLAIFQYRPSPFCVLDEVDAALDEANIERFIGVLQEFLAWTQFIVVTHSKKTMTCASTLYGVTMQESGVSKRVSVRFEDVSDDGEIRISGDGAEVPEGSDGTQAA